MKLSDRMKERGSAHGGTLPARRDRRGATVALGEFKANVHEALFARLGAQLFDSSLSPEQLTAQVAQEITS
jgi:hypothetical protein